MKRLLNMFRVMAVMLLGISVSCTDDYMGEEEPPVAMEKPLELTLNMSVPKVEQSPRSRFLSPTDERALDKEAFHVILFPETTPGSKEYVYSDTSCWYTGSKIKWGKVTPDGDRSIQSLQIQLKPEFKNTSFVLVAFANVYMFRKGSNPSNENKLPTVDELKAMKESILGKNYKAAALSRYMYGNAWPYGPQNSKVIWNIPMWGVSEPFSGNTASIPPVSLLRALARIDVGVNITKNADGSYDLDNMTGNRPDGGDQDFKVEMVHVYNARDGFRLNPEWDNFDKKTGKVIAPSLVSFSPEPDYDTKDYKTYGANPLMWTRKIYIPETDNHGKADRDACCLVIGGMYKGEMSFYRVDFYNREKQGTGSTDMLVPPTPENRYDILRNFVYVVNILRVRGPGYASAEIAAASKPINMEVEIGEWEEGQGMTEVVTDGQYRLAASASELDYHSDGSRKGLSIFTDYAPEYQPDGSSGLPSGWTLTWDGMNDANTTPVQFYDVAGNLIPSREWPEKVFKGAAGTRALLNVGMKRFDAAEGASGERKVTLKFTAGRMSLDVVLTQDTRNVTSFKLTPELLVFPSAPALPQGVVMQARPAGEVELWAYWDDLKEKHKYCFSDPTGHPENSNVPTIFNSTYGGVFFQKSSSGSNTYELKPTENKRAPREMNFTIVAKWPDGSESSAPLRVEQSNVQVDWKVFDDKGMNPLKDNLLIFPANGTEAELTKGAWINTGLTLNWFFSNYTETGNFSGEQWLTNWDELKKPQTGSRPVSFTITPNPGLAKRTMTVWASSNASGFDKTTSYITLEQAAGDVHFQLLQGLGTGDSDLAYDPDKRRYTLNLGSNSLPGWKRLSVLANTNFWWEWNPNPSTEGYDPNDIHLSDDDQRKKQVLLSDFSAPIASGKDNATTNNTGAVDYTWTDAFAFQWPRGMGVFPTESATSDEMLKNMPKAGRYWASMTLTNIHDQISEAQVRENALRLDIVKNVPSVIYIKWPLPDGVNLGNYPLAGDTAKLTAGTNNGVGWEFQVQDEAGSWGTLFPQSIGGVTPSGSGYVRTTKQRILEKFYKEGIAFNQKLKAYRLLLSGPRQVTDGEPDVEWSMSRIYYTGTKINCPTVANTQKFLLSDVRQVVVLDYSNSIYGKLDVRVTETDVNIADGVRVAGPDARPDRVTYYSLDGAKEQRYLIHYMAAHNDEDLASRRRVVKMTVEYWDVINGGWVKHEPEPGRRDWFVVQDASSYDGVVFYPDLLAMPKFPKLKNGAVNDIDKRVYPNLKLYLKAKVKDVPVKDFTGASFEYVYRGADNDDIIRDTRDGDLLRNKLVNYWKNRLYPSDIDIKNIPWFYRCHQDIRYYGGVKNKVSYFFGSSSTEGISYTELIATGTSDGEGGSFLDTYTVECLDRFSDKARVITEPKAVGVRRVSATVASSDISAWSAGKAEKLNANPH